MTTNGKQEKAFVSSGLERDGKRYASLTISARSAGSGKMKKILAWPIKRIRDNIRYYLRKRRSVKIKRTQGDLPLDEGHG